MWGDWHDDLTGGGVFPADAGWQTDRGDSDRWIQTYTGKKFFPLNPRPEDVALEDIAHALGMKCRYTGHCSDFYSVAEHSVLMARYALKHYGMGHALWALLHDAGEAYLPDVCRPIKPSWENFKDIEEAVQVAVMSGLDLYWPPYSIRRTVKEIDTRILLDEMTALMPGIEDRAFGGVEHAPLGVTIRSMDPLTAKVEFLHLYHQLNTHSNDLVPNGR